jgi:arabinosaccharide transport system substrate-binding protein
MLGFPTTSTKADLAWEVGMLLYTSPETARALYTQVDIITPVRALWQDPIYDEPDSFFMGQKKGRMFIELAPDVPIRTSSPYNQVAVFEMRDAAVNLLNWANDRNITDPEAMLDQANILLQRAQANVVRQMSRNAFAETE